MQATHPYISGTFTRILESQKGKHHPLIFAFRKLKQCAEWTNMDIGLVAKKLYLSVHDFYFIVANSGLQDPRKTAKNLCEIQTTLDWDGTEYVQLNREIVEEVFNNFNVPHNLIETEISTKIPDERYLYWAALIKRHYKNKKHRFLVNWRSLQKESEESIYSLSTIGVQKTGFKRFLSKHCAPGEEPTNPPIITNPYYPKGRYPINTSLYFVLNSLIA